jgi:hypothetical protein
MLDKISDIVPNLDNQLDKISQLKEALLLEEIKRDICVIFKILTIHPELESFSYALAYQNGEASFMVDTKNITLKNKQFDYTRKNILNAITYELEIDRNLSDGFLFQMLSQKKLSLASFDELVKNAIGEEKYSILEKEFLESSIQSKDRSNSTIKLKI